MSGENAQHRYERVVLETDLHRLVGDVALPPDGYKSRLSDTINRTDVDFLPLSNVEVQPLDGGTPHSRDFLLVGKAQIRVAYHPDQSA